MPTELDQGTFTEKHTCNGKNRGSQETDTSKKMPKRKTTLPAESP
jgi:hypothetical protein